MLPMPPSCDFLSCIWPWRLFLFLHQRLGMRPTSVSCMLVVGPCESAGLHVAGAEVGMRGCMEARQVCPTPLTPVSRTEKGSLARWCWASSSFLQLWPRGWGSVIGSLAPLAN